MGIGSTFNPTDVSGVKFDSGLANPQEDDSFQHISNGSFDDTEEDLYAYDLSYEYPINDSMSITPFVYISETTGTTTDTTGAGAFMSFSF